MSFVSSQLGNLVHFSLKIGLLVAKIFTIFVTNNSYKFAVRAILKCLCRKMPTGREAMFYYGFVQTSWTPRANDFTVHGAGCKWKTFVRSKAVKRLVWSVKWQHGVPTVDYTNDIFTTLLLAHPPRHIHCLLTACTKHHQQYCKVNIYKFIHIKW